MAIVALILLQPIKFVKPSTLHVPFVDSDKTCWNAFSSAVELIALFTAATEEYDVVEYVTIELATTLPCLFSIYKYKLAWIIYVSI